MTANRPDLPLHSRAEAAAPPLAGVRVVDFTRVVAGPFGTQILADLGAEVIKIENPLGGDDTRTSPGGAELGGESSFYLSLNRGKKSVAVDLKSESGRRIILDLLATADVLVENFTGAVMRRFGLDYPSLRERLPTLVYCSISAYGRSGRNADAAGYDSPVTAEAGALGLNRHESGRAPVLGAIPYTDLSTALNAVIAVLAALRARDRDGLGQHVDVAMFDTAVANLSFQAAAFLASGTEPALNVRRTAMPRGVFDTADGSMVITCAGEKMFRALCLDVVHRPDWLDTPEFSTQQARIRNSAAFLREMDAIFTRESGAVWSQRCKRAGIPCGVVRSVGDALISDEASEREVVFDLPHPTAGRVPAIAQPYRLSRTPCDYRTPPLLAEHSREVLTDLLGYDERHIAVLEKDGAVRLMDSTQPVPE
ncbi:CoA transferase [Nocardia sp. NBC_01377]|uniref:CaiB/BaiF CoA transferase family protein n=1 Tax=Nocardia sp. NBC_01377 TaxID=2903595 RepID=UPI0032557663